jgi:hypothetical protein
MKYLTKALNLMVLATWVAICASPAVAAPAQAPAKKPNILIIWGDDIGYWNVSAYNQGMMGYKTPNIDRIAKEGAMFTDWYGEQSCTAGRSALLTGQSGFRTGNLKVGLPGAKARTTSVISTSICRLPTVLTNFLARSTTSTPRKNRRTRITSRIRN